MKRANLISVVALLAALAACVGAFRPAGNAGVTSCAKIAYDYVKQVAAAQQLKITYYRLLACHQVDADHTVARAHVIVSYYGLTQDVTLAFHLTRSPWQTSDVHPVAG